MEKGHGKGGAHILIIPFPAAGHLLPHLDLTNQLLLRGLTATVVVTPEMLHYLNTILSLHSPNIQPLVLPFPTHSPILVGVENIENVTIHLLPHMVTAFSELHDPLVDWFRSHPSPPVAIITDLFLCCWVNKLASHLNIPNIGFSALNANTVLSWFIYGKDPAVSLPGEIFIGCMQSWGIIFNTFRELDGEKMNFIKEDFIKHDRLWAVGPLPRINKAPNMVHSEKDQRPSSTLHDQVIAWLDSCDVDKSVVYVGFGTQISLSNEQMEAVASALETSGVRFIWTVKIPSNGDNQSLVIPKGFEDRVAGRGLVIKGWAPQVAILGHRAVGSYLTHCGWNSTLEGILGGVLLLAWPMQADHFNNTKLLVDELGAAIKVCEGLETVPDATKLAQILADSVKTARPERIQAMKLQRSALDAIKEGGSSYKSLDVLAEELSCLST
ncbi:UDP-glycosyltransferase 89C1-like [Durio zibethinus]|uniref:UDP-glycosyltransferase 89C1-like n=1 Tax=Durio zibethinus TaxID=66656 RepID=A0A6P5Y118_DURZI|nr:UDP-glycosyltransferase 89C1-like [Durio zibethinus]